MSDLESVTDPASRDLKPRTNRTQGSGPVSRGAVGQAAAAVAIAALAYLALIYVQQYFGHGLRYRQSFFGHWTEFVCLLLASWSLFALLLRWRTYSRRAACLRYSPFPRNSSLEDYDLDQVVVSLREAGRQYDEDFVAARAERLADEFRLTGDGASVSEASNAESAAAQVELESSYAPVRIFAWTIPLLGLIGTVLGIGQALGDFGGFLASGSQKPEEVRAALYQATYDLGSAFEVTLVAILLTVIVSVTLLLVLHSEKSLLRSLDDACRTKLLPLMRRRDPMSGSSSIPGALEAQEMMVEHLSLLREEMASAMGQFEELSRHGTEQGAAMLEEISRHLIATEALLSAQRDTLDALIESSKGRARTVSDIGRADVPLIGGKKGRGKHLAGEVELPLFAPNQPALDTLAIRTTLGQLSEVIREVNPVLRKLAEHLREQAREPGEGTDGSYAAGA